VYGDGFVFQLCTRHFVEGLKRKAREVGAEHDRPVVEAIGLIRSVLASRTLATAGRRLGRLEGRRFVHPAAKAVVCDFGRHAEDLMAYLLHPELNLPHTNNDGENLFRQLNQRLKSLGSFRTWRYAEDYLRAWAMYRRTTPFTDCRGGRKRRNGKSPLQLAGCDVVDNDFLTPLKPTRF